MKKKKTNNDMILTFSLSEMHTDNSTNFTLLGPVDCDSFYKRIPLNRWLVAISSEVLPSYLLCISLKSCFNVCSSHSFTFFHALCTEMLELAVQVCETQSVSLLLKGKKTSLSRKNESGLICVINWVAQIPHPNALPALHSLVISFYHLKCLHP